MIERRQFLKSIGGAVASIALTQLAFAQKLSDQKPNVLFIAVDDMADWVGCLGGHPDVLTPNIDRLANRGTLFTNAHCVSPICGPSRAAVLTGMRPETTGAYTNQGTYIDYVPDAVSLPRFFKDNNYQVMGAGKINHGLGMVVPDNWHEYGPGCGVVGTPFTNEELLSEGMDPTRTIDRDKLKCTLPMNGGLSLIDRPTMKWDTFDWGPLDLTDDDFPDGEIANWGIEQLQKKYDKPFFLGVGFYKPHQPFFLPRKYFDMYDTEKISLPPTIAGDLNDVPQPGKDLALAAWSSGTHKTVTKYNKWREAVEAYLATITFADAQVGKVLDALDSSEYADDTWIVFWSDHGWELGEKEHWGKHDPWQGSVKVPLIIVPPQKARLEGFKPGSRCDAPVSLLDLYPTLIEMCNLPNRKELEGQSLLPLVCDTKKKWNEAVVASIGRGSHSVFTHRWRYIHYFDGSEELYDLRVDPEEWFNLSDNPKFTNIKKDLDRHIPIDKRFRQFVRWGRWKAVYLSNGEIMLFDIHAIFGISEHDNVAGIHPEVIQKITNYLRKNKITSRYVTMPN